MAIELIINLTLDKGKGDKQPLICIRAITNYIIYLNIDFFKRANYRCLKPFALLSS